VQAQLGEKTNWSDSEDLSMMFQGAYKDEFYRALHDALHARVDSWNSSSSQIDRDGPSPDELWNRVLQLEKSCRNQRPTVAPSLANQQLVQLQAGPGLTCGDD
jgi:hypothetical protein